MVELTPDVAAGPDEDRALPHRPARPRSIPETAMALTLRFWSTHPLLARPEEQRLDIAEGQELVAGRLPTADLRIAVEDRRISRHHFSILLEDGRLVLVNKSLNGTMIDEIPVEGSVDLEDGDVIGLGELSIRVAVTVAVTDAPAERGEPAPPSAPLNARAPVQLPAIVEETIREHVAAHAVAPQRSDADRFALRRPDSLVGREVGGYRFEDALPPGPLGPRYRAVQTALDRTVELQLVERSGPDPQAGRVQRLFRTARIAVRLVHPHVVQIHDCGELPELDAYFMTTEHVDGVWLDARIESGPMPMPLDEALRITREIGGALEHAHASKIVHRNIAPESIVLCHAGGAAKLAGLALTKTLDDDVRLTRSGVVMGSLRYSAPEQLTDPRRVDPRSDLYALAAVLYHLVCGRPHLDARSLAEQVKALVGQPKIIPPSAIVAGLPIALDRALAKAMTFEPAERYASVAAFLDGLAAVDHHARSPDAPMLSRTRVTYLAMLPRIPTSTGIDWGVHFAPVDAVGGDFYDVFELGDGRLGALVGDVSGHGLDAAMAVGMAKTSCRIYARTEGSPARALGAANTLVRPQLAQGRFFTCCLGMLDPKERTFVFARGGHNPVLLHNPERDPSLQWLAPEGCAIGVMPDRAFHQIEHALYLTPGDLLLLFSDGVPEATDADGEPFELERLATLVAARGPEESASRTVARIAAALAAWCTGVPTDDVTLLAFRVA